MRTLDRRRDRIRRLQAAISRDEHALRMAGDTRDRREEKRLLEDLQNQRIYLAEFVSGL